MSDLRQQADAYRQRWAMYKTWADDPKTSEEMPVLLAPVVTGLDAYADHLHRKAQIIAAA